MESRLMRKFPSLLPITDPINNLNYWFLSSCWMFLTRYRGVRSYQCNVSSQSKYGQLWTIFYQLQFSDKCGVSHDQEFIYLFIFGLWILLLQSSASSVCCAVIDSIYWIFRQYSQLKICFYPVDFNWILGCHEYVNPLDARCFILNSVETYFSSHWALRS